MPIMRCASTAGTSSKKLESGGDAPMSSPAVNVRVLGLAARSACQYAEMTAAPPICEVPTLNGSSWPCQSDTFKIWISTVGRGAAITLVLDAPTINKETTINTENIRRDNGFLARLTDVESSIQSSSDEFELNKTESMGKCTVPSSRCFKHGCLPTAPPLCNRYE